MKASLLHERLFFSREKMTNFSNCQFGVMAMQVFTIFKSSCVCKISAQRENTGESVPMAEFGGDRRQIPF